MQLPQPSPEDGEIISCDLPWGHANPSPSSDHSTWQASSSTGASSASSRDVNPSYTTNTTVELPLDDPSMLFFLTKGSFASGAIRFVASEPGQGGRARHDFAVVDVVLGYWNEDHRKYAKICSLKKSNGAYGLGIYVSEAVS